MNRTRTASFPCFLLVSVFLVLFVFIGCDFFFPPEEITVGSISGFVFFENDSDHSGIHVSIEPLTDTKTAAVRRAGEKGEVLPRVIVAHTQTTQDGAYHFSDMEAGGYTLYASSDKSLQKAVSIDVTVTAGKTATVEDLYLVPTGTVSGRITVENQTSGNLGFLVFLAGTSYMAVTDDAGNFTITDVPSGINYTLVVTKGPFESSGTTVTVQSGVATTVDPINVLSAQLTVTGALEMVMLPQGNAVKTNEAIFIDFGRAVDIDSVINSFSISPVIAGIENPITNIRGGGRSMSFPQDLYYYSVREPYLAPNTTYTVTVNGALDAVGNNIPPLSWSFTTRGAGVNDVRPWDQSVNKSTWGEVQIGFATSMDRYTTENALTFKDSDGNVVATSYSWQGELTPDSILILRPFDEYLQTNTTHTLTVGTGAQTSAGVALASSFSSQFTTERLKVNYTSPRDGDVRVDVNPYMWFDFNNPMNVETVRGCYSLVKSDDGTPVTGNVITSYSDDDTDFRYELTEELLPYTTYTGTISTDAQAKDGTFLPTPYVFSFATRGGRVDYTYPNDGETDVSLSIDVNVRFSCQMNTEATQEAFSMQDEHGTPVTGTFDWPTYYNDDYLTFYPSENLSAGTKYNVTIGTGATAANGGYALENTPYTFYFTTATQ